MADQLTTAAKAYRLLRAVLMTATADGLILTNPCVVRRAGLERDPERLIPSLDIVEAGALGLDDLDVAALRAPTGASRA